MNLFAPINTLQVYAWETSLDDGFFLLAFGILAAELIRYAAKKELTLPLLGDVVTNYITLVLFLGSTYLLLGGAYLAGYAAASKIAFFGIETNLATIALCVVLADLAYYWEHRFMHRVNLAWATHTAHHSSPYFNISVAYRFGPMDGVWPFLFHVPLVLLGFDPLVVFASEALVQMFQTALHTEAIGKLPRPIEAVFNTPSHHRVHHGSNPEYLDRNYGGIFIVWDRMFGSFALEEADVVYGLTKPLTSRSPLTAFFGGFARLARRFRSTRGLRNKLALLVAPPEWQPALTPES